VGVEEEAMTDWMSRRRFGQWLGLAAGASALPGVAETGRAQG
jgi:hypothetical protein